MVWALVTRATGTAPGGSGRDIEASGAGVGEGDLGETVAVLRRV